MRKLLLKLTLFVGICSLPCWACADSTQDSAPSGLSGDIGLSVYSQNAFTQGNTHTVDLLPYAYFDYGRFFARIDTFGIKTVPVAYGNLEIVTRYETEGFKPKGGAYSQINQRDSPIPLGLGTFQLTPIGAFFLYAFEDVTKSKGKIVEFTYAAEVDLPSSIKIYPLLGFDYKDKRYLNYFYGVSSNESQISGINSYSPSDGISPFAGLIIEVPLGGHWILNTFMRQKWLASTIVNSPLVTERRVDNIFTSLSYRFE